MKLILPWFGVAALLVAQASGALAQSIIHVPVDATLQNAIDSIDNGGTIEIAGGTYAAPVNAFRVTDPQKHFTIRAATNQIVTITSTSGASDGLFVITSSNPNQGQHLTFEHIRFQSGVSDMDERAGAVTMANTDVTFFNCVFEGNAAESTGPTGGGGGALLARYSRILIVDSIFSGNHAWRSGGAIDIRGGSQLAIHNSAFLGNQTNLGEHFVHSLGGAIFVLNSLLRVTNTQFEDNQAGFAGGAVYSYGDWSPEAPGITTDLLIANSSFAGNSAHCNSSTCPANFVTVAGALEAENDVTARIYHSRFVDNHATQGGAVQLYRSQMSIHGSTFLGNRATGTAPGMGFGGAIVVVSADQDVSDPVNHPSAELTITDSIFQGGYGPTTTTARYGGCIFTQGDYNREYGRSGIPQSGSVEYNRAKVDITGSIFSDCDVQGDTYPSGIGGGLEAQLSQLTLSESLFIGCDALAGIAGTGSGGALAIEDQTLANITDVTIANSSAAFNGAAIWAAGAELNLNASQVINNQLTTAQFDGAAIYSASENLGQLNKATGLVEYTLFSNNTAPNGKHVIYDYDNGSLANPNNLMQYSSNRIYPDDNSVYSNPIWGSGDVAFLNGIAVKTLDNNTGLETEPVTADLVSAPTSTLSSNAPGDPTAPTKAYVGVAWSGAAATLDGVGITGNALLQPVVAGAHVLSVGPGTTLTTVVDQRPVPTSKLTLQPPVVDNGNALLAWQTTSGTFLDQVIDQGVAVAQPSTANGVAPVSQDASTTYHGLMIATEGGAYTNAHLTVAADLIFFDGFDH